MSALVAPSRSLRAILALFALANAAGSGLVAFVLPERFSGAPALAAFLLLASLFSLHACLGATKTHRIDVSGTGTIRLTVQQEMGADALTSSGTVVTLLPETLVWPQLLLLHLLDAQGKRTVVTVLSDSLAPDEYRTLRVALGVLAKGAAPAATTSEIL